MTAASRICAAVLMVLTIDGHAAPPAGGDLEGERLRLFVSPAVALAPALVRILVNVEPAPGNRLLEIVAESGEYLRSSSLPLEGARASRFHRVEYRAVPAGAYTVVATLIGDDGEVSASAIETVLVVD
jgi:hypothetical protein